MARTKQSKRKQPPRKSTVSAYKCLNCAKGFKDADTLLAHCLKDKHLSEETLQVLMQEAEKHRVTESEEGEGHEEETSSKKMKGDEEHEDLAGDSSVDMSGDVSASVDEENKEGAAEGGGGKAVIETSSSSSGLAVEVTKGGDVKVGEEAVVESSADIAASGMAVEEDKEGDAKGEAVVESSSSSADIIAASGLAVEENKKGDDETKEGIEGEVIGIDVPSKKMEVEEAGALDKEQVASFTSADVENREENVNEALGKAQAGEVEGEPKKMEVVEEKAAAEPQQQ